MSFTTQDRLYKILDEGFMVLSKILHNQGVKNYNIVLYGFPEKPKSRFKIASVGVEDSTRKKLLFYCDIIIHQYNCGCLSVMIKAYDYIKEGESLEPQYLKNGRIGKDDVKVANLSTSFYDKKLTSKILVADIMLKFSRVIQTIYNINPN
jgi:hypothetical protein